MEAGRFFRRGVTKVWWVPTIVVPSAATVAEVTAGQNLSPSIADIAGFNFENQPIPTPDLDDSFTGSIPGEDTAEASALTFYEKKTTNPHMSTLAKGTPGFVVIFFAGIAGETPAAGDDYDAWPVLSTGKRRLYSMGNDPAQWSCGFTPTGRPAEDGAIAA